MRVGTIVEYDPEKGSGRVHPDNDDDTFVFDIEKGQRHTFKKGDRVRFDVEGGMAGVEAVDVRHAGEE